MKNTKRILVTGAAGSIGSAFILKALEKNFSILGIDNFSNSHEKTIEAITSLYPDRFIFEELDISKRGEGLTSLLKRFQPGAILHLASLKSVTKSDEFSTLYWRNNLLGTINLIDSMSHTECKKILFSSSAAVYDQKSHNPISEDSHLDALSTYGKTKIAIEKLLTRLSQLNKIKAVILRYFNVIGTYKLNQLETKGDGSLISNIQNVIQEKEKTLEIYGNTFQTKDGTAERDFVHIADVIEVNFKAIEFLNGVATCSVFNVGTGTATSVLKMVATFEEVIGRKIGVQIKRPRDNELPSSCANIEKAKNELKWTPSKSLSQMCEDSCRIR
jgi:UDP-glucose 4-epimerase